jgi:hypothetical protein
MFIMYYATIIYYRVPSTTPAQGVISDFFFKKIQLVFSARVHRIQAIQAKRPSNNHGKSLRLIPYRPNS